ncbi:MAG TPA: hypothetical protein VFX25_35170 [Streptosporangiaceae bacterium]|nr:hypothetical protein [Streptosporangiaceae bacterium]
MACTRCGRTAPAGAGLCRGCERAVTSAPGRRPHGRRLVLVTAALVLAAATTWGVVLSVADRGAGPGGAGRPAAAAARLPVAAAAPSSGPSAGGRMRTAAGRPGVAMAAGVRGRPAAAGAAAFLTRYFGVINRHDYRGYLRLFGPGSGRSLSAAAFAAGYGTTRDSAETLRGITAGGRGLVAAAVTFTSRQAAAASPAHAGCVRWRITIYLARRDGRYVIANPPAGYAAADRAC